MEPFFRESDENRKSRPDRAPVRVRASAQCINPPFYLVYRCDLADLRVGSLSFANSIVQKE